MSKKIIIDVASHQADMTVQDYKNSGASAAIIKLTEGTYYRNPYAKEQINKAAAAGIKHIHFYMYQRQTTVSGMLAEVDYCLQYARELNLKNCYIFLDVEEKNAVPSEQAVLQSFSKLRKAGFKAGFYTYQFMYPKLSKKCFTESDGVWAAAYPTMSPVYGEPNMAGFPSQDNVMMWQFTSAWKGKSLDASIDIDGRLFAVNKPQKPQKPKVDTYYHSRRVKALVIKNACNIYDGLAFSKAKKLGEAKEDKEYKVVDVWDKGKKSTDISRYKIEYAKGKYGWVTGNQYYVSSAYYLDKTYSGKTKIKALKSCNVYDDKDLKKDIGDIKKGETYTVVENVSSSAGTPRFKLRSGKYVTARKDYWKFV